MKTRTQLLGVVNMSYIEQEMKNLNNNFRLKLESKRKIMKKCLLYSVHCIVQYI